MCELCKKAARCLATESYGKGRGDESFSKPVQ